MHSHRVFKFKPELAVQIASFLGLEIVELIIAFYLRSNLRLILFYAEDEIIFQDE